MPKLLYIESSPRKDRSNSIAVAKAFLDAYRERHPDHEVETWDLWSPDERLPEFDGAAITAKYAVMGGASHDAPEAEAWRVVGQSADRLKSADVLLLGVPMWNFGVPYKLKHLIDVVTQPGMTFNVDPATRSYIGLTPAKTAVVVSARSGVYSGASPVAAMDMEAPYVKNWLTFIGVADVREVFVEGTAAGPDAAKTAVENATAKAREIAGTL